MLSDLVSVLIYMNSWLMQLSGCDVPVAAAYCILDYRTFLYCFHFPGYPPQHHSQIILHGCHTIM